MIKIKKIRWTDEDIKNLVLQTDCNLISIDRKECTYLNLLCKCGSPFRTTLANFKNKDKKQCNKCGKEITANKLRTPFNIVKEFFKDQGYILLSTEYKNDRIYLDSICPEGHPYKVRYNKFKAGDRCPICAGNYKNHEMYKEQIKNIRNNEFEAIEKYQKAHIEIKHKHKICGLEFYATPNNFLDSPGCPRCDKFRRWNAELIKEKIYKMHNGEYELLEDFKTTTQKHLFLHKPCGNKYMADMGGFLQGTRCPFCFGNIKKTTEQYKNEVESLTNQDYVVLQEYINGHTKILHKHIDCGNEFLMSPACFLYQEQRCPKCNQTSKGERKIRQWLKDNQIIYIPEFKFKDLKSDKNYYLRFDFAIFDENNQLYCLVEFDGKQHFEWIKHMMPYDEFLLVQQRDNLKNQYCEKNNIPLLRIHYKNYKKINDILDIELNHLKNPFSEVI